MIIDKDLERRVRERAYELWMQNGCLPDRSDEYWYQAEQEVLARPASEDDRGPVPESLSPEVEANAPEPGVMRSFEPDEVQGSFDVSSASLNSDDVATDEAMPAPSEPKTRRRRNVAPAVNPIDGDAPATGAPRRRRSPRTSGEV
ncbi:DUF2934 domain-containing protein [Microvirga rosea]|uniref:DUF2934 domain-containing protein n=1 Tax=Microvirga rosea TaxID=2715425 RepID=UPI001D0B1D0F|nr:DUF2934 domain-containing protein [Microvirga rosea]MCB8822187.1 DUF2934 domain-containing protein [Microvirga rosea]